jgi:hypothetical protein
MEKPPEKLDEFGRPIRKNWAAHYQGTAMVVYGHTPVYQPQWVNNTLCIDTGCVFWRKTHRITLPRTHPDFSRRQTSLLFFSKNSKRRQRRKWLTLTPIN